MFNPGFSGGTTEGAWRKILETYPDRVEELQSRPMAFVLDGQRIDARSVRYRLRQGATWEEAAWPKVLLPDAQIGAVQTAFAPWLTLFLREPPPGRSFAFDFPVAAVDGGPAELRIEVAWEPATGALTSWWIAEHNLDNPRLRA